MVHMQARRIQAGAAGNCYPAPAFPLRLARFLLLFCASAFHDCPLAPFLRGASEFVVFLVYSEFKFMADARRSSDETRNSNTKADVAERLGTVLASTYALRIKTQNFHWNITGPNFIGLHTLLETHYKELDEAIDVVAERIRALDAVAISPYVLRGASASNRPNGRQTYEAHQNFHCRRLVGARPCLHRARYRDGAEGDL